MMQGRPEVRQDMHVCESGLFQAPPACMSVSPQFNLSPPPLLLVLYSIPLAHHLSRRLLTVVMKRYKGCLLSVYLTVMGLRS